MLSKRQIVQPGDAEFTHPGRKGMLSKLFKRPWPPGFFWGGCPCCSPSLDCDQCEEGTGPQVWDFTLSGITNSFCGDCDDHNTTTELNYVSGCLWESAEVPSCATEVWKFGYNAGLDSWFLSHKNIAVILRYSIAGDDFDCEAENVLDFDFDNHNQCTNWPSTITITPV